MLRNLHVRQGLLDSAMKRTPLPIAKCRYNAVNTTILSRSFSSVLFVRKQTTETAEACSRITDHLRSRYPNVQIYRESTETGLEGESWSPGVSSLPIDLVVTLGGDGTILHANTLFRHGPVPPVLSFSMGTLGFLLPFHIKDFVKAIEHVAQGRHTVLERLRLQCSFQDMKGQKLSSTGGDGHVMNEIALHRSGSAHLNTYDVFVDGQHLTEGVSDGIIISTPTGSTAYSLSAGGPIVHPSTSAMLLTPICPRSLSFRSLIFPSTSSITLQLSVQSRAPAGTYLDGQESHILQPGQSVTVRASPYPIPSINRSSMPNCAAYEDAADAGTNKPEDDWVRDINGLLQYNATFRSKALLRHNY